MGLWIFQPMIRMATAMLMLSILYTREAMRHLGGRQQISGHINGLYREHNTMGGAIMGLIPQMMLVLLVGLSK